MRTLWKCLAVAVACSAAVPAAAVDVASGSVQLGSSSSTQLGRLSRGGVQQDWVGDETFPGVFNPTTSYAYTTIAVPFGGNASQTVYYDIDFDDVASDLFISAYLDSYDPSNIELNWLGDAGSSGNYFGTDPLFFDVVVPTGHTLMLVINSANSASITSVEPSSIGNYLVSAFSDTEYDEDFVAPPAPVPEPGIWSLMILGIGLTGAALRRTKRRLTTTGLAAG